MPSFRLASSAKNLFAAITLVLGSVLPALPACATDAAFGLPAASHHHAFFGSAPASRDARQIADWIVDSADNLGLAFAIVDKISARVFVFDPGGTLQGASPALLGLARGDHAVAGIGDREYADMPPSDRTTPAGRFVAEMGVNALGVDIVWVDYDSGVSLHRVVTGNAKEQRLQRLATPTPLDNRISYGCINVPARFYDQVVRPAFTRAGGIVYVLPETRPAREFFGAYDVQERWRLAAPASRLSRYFPGEF
jgi:hypothetical protein